MISDRSQRPPDADPAQDRPPDQPPDLEAALLRHMPATIPGQSALLVAILVLLAGYTVYFAKPVLVPLLLAVMLNLLLSPVVARLRRFGLPEPAGAALVLVALLMGLGWAGYALSGPAIEWMDRAPLSVAEISEKLRPLREPVEQASQQVEKLADQVARDDDPRLVTIEDQSWSELFVFGTTQLLTQTFIVVVLLYFLLASGDLFMRRFVRALSSGQEKRQAVEIVRAVKRDVTTYLGTVTLINAGLGAATGAAMAVIGLPNPVLWGVLVAMLNFVPYAGAMLSIAVLAFVGLVTFDQLGRALAPPLAFFALTNIEANLVTPILLGGRLTLNPALVFVALVAWTWLWGIPGALLAVPMLVVFKAFADHLKSWNGISIFLGRRD